MSVHFQFIHKPRRGAVMIYALVFAITAAVALYVASSIYQTRARASAMRAYGEQRAQLMWNFEHILRAARQNALDAGVGLADMDAWATYNPSTYTPVTWDTPIQNVSDPTLLGQSYLTAWVADAGTLWTNNSASVGYSQNSFFVNGSLRSTTSDSLMDMSGATARNGTNFFTSSDMFTVPGWRPRRNGETGSAVVPHDPLEISQNFVFFSNNTFPEALRWRSDLPFGPTPDSSWLATGSLMQDTGYMRWARDVLQINLAAKNSDIATLLGGTQNTTATLWMVEEPITNYQLVLIDPLNNNQWPGGNLAGNIRIADSNLNGNVYRPKILIHGPVASGLTNLLKGGWLTGRNTAGNATMPDPLPLAMVAGGGVDSSVLAIAPAATEGFEWRVAKPSTRLSFGRAPGNINSSLPTQAPDLGQFLIAQMEIAPAIGTAAYERRLEVRNAQASVMPALYTTNISGAPGNYCYLNSVLSMREDGAVYWTAQGATGANNNVMGPPFQLPFNASASPEYWVYGSPGLPSGPLLPANNASQIQLQYGPQGGPMQSYDNNANDMGLSGVHYYQPGFSATVVSVDLSKVAMRQDTVASGVGTPPAVPAWMSPIEINIENKNPGTNLLYVRILGDADANPAGGGRPPVRIVVRGAAEVRLVPDTTPAVAGVGNFRRFILTSPDQNTMNLTLETSGPSYRWYGVLIAPYGVSINNYSAFSITGSTPSLGSAQAATLIWQGTILARHVLKVNSGSLELRPDDGLGTPTINPNDSNACAAAFVPRYNGSAFLGRPVPLLVPRMVWTFE